MFVLDVRSNLSHSGRQLVQILLVETTWSMGDQDGFGNVLQGGGTGKLLVGFRAKVQGHFNRTPLLDVARVEQSSMLGVSSLFSVVQLVSHSVVPILVIN